MREMSWALAAKITVWSILFIIAYALFVVVIARFAHWLGNKYPALQADRDIGWDQFCEEVEEKYGPPGTPKYDRPQLLPDDEQPIPFALDYPTDQPRFPMPPIPPRVA